MSRRRPPDRTRLALAFWSAAGISLLLNWLQPYGRFLLYPFSMLSTWAHEMGHGLTALLLGGEFRELVLRADLGGHAMHTASGPIAAPLAAMGGLLGPAVCGSVVIVLGARSEKACRAVLWVLTVAVLLSTVVWIHPVASSGFNFGFLVMLVIGVALAAAAWWGGEFTQLLLTQMIGIQLCLGALADFDYMFTESFERDGQTVLSDTGSIAEHWLLPFWVWGGLVAVFSVLLLLSAFYVAWLRGSNSADDRPKKSKARAKQKS